MNQSDLRNLLRDRKSDRPIIVQPDRQLKAAPPADEPKQRGPQMNGWERKYAQHLSTLQAAGEVRWFEYEWVRLRLADGAWFKPDFAVIMGDGSLQFHEVKGHWREAAKVRIRVAADRFPFVFVVVTLQEGVWKREVIAA